MVTAALITKVGFHLRPAGVFSNEMGKFSCDVWLSYGGARINGKSVMNVLSAGIPAGAELTVCCEGPGEENALKRAAFLIERELQE